MDDHCRIMTRDEMRSFISAIGIYGEEDGLNRLDYDDYSEQVYKKYLELGRNDRKKLIKSARKVYRDAIAEIDEEGYTEPLEYDMSLVEQFIREE